MRHQPASTDKPLERHSSERAASLFLFVRAAAQPSGEPTQRRAEPWTHEPFADRRRDRTDARDPRPLAGHPAIRWHLKQKKFGRCAGQTTNQQPQSSKTHGIATKTRLHTKYGWFVFFASEPALARDKRRCSKRSMYFSREKHFTPAAQRGEGRFGQPLQASQA